MTEIAVEANATPAQLPNIHVAVLGAGKMGGILLQAFLKQNLFAPDQIHATVAQQGFLSNDAALRIQQLTRTIIKTEASAV